MFRLARDVGVNVVANLIAGGIIYLGAVAAGLLPYSALFTYVAYTFLGVCGVLIVVGAYMQVRQKNPLLRHRLGVIAGVALILTCAVTIAYGCYLVITIGWDSWIGYLVPMIALSTAAGGIIKIRWHQQDFSRMKTNAEIKQRQVIDTSLHLERRQAYLNRPNRHRASREPHIIRRQRLPQRKALQ